MLIGLMILMELEFLIICSVESNFNPQAVNGDAVGIAQIRPICVDDVNKILGEDVYSNEDRLDVNKSREIYWVYTTHYGGSTFEERARIWVGGPSGRGSDSYWKKVKETRNEYFRLGDN